MVAEHTQPIVDFAGSKTEKALAERAFQVIRAGGMFGSSYAPISASLDALVAYLDSDAAHVRAAIVANAHVFALTKDGDTELVATSRVGRPPVEMTPDTRHSFAARFMTPQTAPERPLRTEKPMPEVVINSRVADEIADARLERQQVERELEREGIITTTRGNFTVELLTGEAAAREVAAREAAREAAAREAELRAQADMPTQSLEPVVAAEIVDPAELESEVVAEAVQVEAIAPEITESADEATAPELVIEDDEPETETEALELTIEDEQPAVEEPVVAETPAPAPAPAPTPVRLTDLSAFSDDAIAEAITRQLRRDTRVAHFGGQWMADERLHRLSRGNLRRFSDYISEQEQPLTDATLAQDVLSARRSAPDFAAIRFSINHGLSTERGFEFVGTRDQPFWGTTELPQLGTTRRKATEIGTDYRFLVDEVPLGSVEARTVTSVEHVLTFYEFTYGLLPLDQRLQALLPAPVMPDQRAAVLTVEIPQFENSVYLVEVRYPTATRGGFLLGLDDFYEEKLVPGAMLSIQATDNDGNYRIEWLEDTEQQDRFLELDDRRAPKYVFRPLTYDTAVSSDWLVTESRFPGFNGEKPLTDKRRRRLEDVIEATLVRIGEAEGGARIATFDDLLVAVNIERPASATAVRTAVDGMSAITDDGTGILTFDAAS